jgi:hypothetical protein
MKAWFNERGYVVIAEKGESKFIYDLPAEMTNNASILYNCRWMVLNQLLDTIKELGETVSDKDLVLYSDSRLIEELQGDIAPDNEYAKSSLRYFIEVDYVRFRRISFQKCATTTINEKLSESVESSRPTTA